MLWRGFYTDLSASKHKDSFFLKGGLMLMVWDPAIPKLVRESGFIEADGSNLKQRSGVEAAHALRMGDADGFKVEDVGDEKSRFLN